MGHSPAGLFGYSHLLGGFAGGQAEYLRVPFADVGPIKVPDGLPDEQVLFLSDIFPTGYMAAENCRDRAGRHGRGLGLRPGRRSSRSRAPGCSARAGDRDRPVPERLAMARDQGKAETINFDEEDVYDRLRR